MYSLATGDSSTLTGMLRTCAYITHSHIQSHTVNKYMPTCNTLYYTQCLDEVMLVARCHCKVQRGALGGGCDTVQLVNWTHGNTYVQDVRR